MGDKLPLERRIQVEELIVYETGVMESFEDMFGAALKAARARRKLEGRGGGGGMDDGDNNNADERAMWVVVFSPTGCDAMLRTLGMIPVSEREGIDGDGISTSMNRGEEEEKEKKRIKGALRDCYIATIGPTTRDHLRGRYGVEPDVCAEIPSPEGVGKGIQEFLLERTVR
ncbi:NADH-ubiquinone oxidoreductase [Histoplasma capsulatum G186AR]|nr:NADH-ubiquinone oxidoreductase [Histoplasma capsulatum]QSS69108.1 NADH-ubiquinone oxidoreductase [Histoplasma capsulatum G186AR]